MPQLLKNFSIYEKIPDIILILLFIGLIYFLIKLPLILKNKKLNDINGNLLHFFTRNHNLTEKEIDIILEFSKNDNVYVNHELFINKELFEKKILEKQESLLRKIFDDKEIEKQLRIYKRLKDKIFYI